MNVGAGDGSLIPSPPTQRMNNLSPSSPLFHLPVIFLAGSAFPSARTQLRRPRKFTRRTAPSGVSQILLSMILLDRRTQYQRSVRISFSRIFK